MTKWESTPRLPGPTGPGGRLGAPARIGAPSTGSTFVLIHRPVTPDLLAGIIAAAGILPARVACGGSACWRGGLRGVD